MDSNGYIMLDFSPIDFSKKNQVIYGLFDRISDVKAVNKFIIILNIQGNKTPLPAVMTYINNSYVIESFLYNFTITNDDNIRIDNVSADIIKDGIISAGSTWSSQKISNELANIPLIDDTDVSSDTTWSSEKIISLINDDSISDDYTWSSEKINDELVNSGGTKIYKLITNVSFNAAGITDLSTIIDWSRYELISIKTSNPYHVRCSYAYGDNFNKYSAYLISLSDGTVITGGATKKCVLLYIDK